VGDENGGPGRNRTDVRGFAGPCITTLPPGLKGAHRGSLAVRHRDIKAAPGPVKRTTRVILVYGMLCAIVIYRKRNYKFRYM
jgi:hypothetical protein